MRQIVYILMLSLLCGGAWGQTYTDLTPSLNFYNYDYGSDATSATIDSICALRYDALIADASYGAAWATKYDDYFTYAGDSLLLIFVYVDGCNIHGTTAGMTYLDEMASILTDSTAAMWHTDDSVYINESVWLVPYSESESGSRLLSYSGNRTLWNYMCDDMPEVFADVIADSLKGLHSGSSWSLDGIFFDNWGLGTPITSCGVEDTTGELHETGLGGASLHWGASGWGTWNKNYKDSVRIKYGSEFVDSLWTRETLLALVNASGWGCYSDPDVSCWSYHTKYYDTSLQSGRINRAQEWGGDPYRARHLCPGPTNGTGSIDSATVAECYDPPTLYADEKTYSAKNNGGQWYNPADTSKHYGFKQNAYDAMTCHYLTKADNTYFMWSCDPDNLDDWHDEMNWIAGDSPDTDCPHAGNSGDSCYWIDAFGVRLGREDDAGWESDTVAYYCSSVSCSICEITGAHGVDPSTQNWIVFRRSWNGDDGYRYMVLHRPCSDHQDDFSNVWSHDFALPTGTWAKLAIDGTWSGTITADSLQNGQGFVYRMETGDTPKKTGAAYLRKVKL